MLALLGFCSAAGAAQQAPLPPPELDLAFSRYYAGTVALVDDRTALVLRADRDITALKVEVRAPSGAADAGRWEARLIALPPTEEPVEPDLRAAAARPATWRAIEAVRERRPVTTTVQALVPRALYQNWLLWLEPREAGAKPVELAVTATPIDYDGRVRWLMAMRAQWNPDEQPDRTRDLVRYLTDEEVRRWTGVRDRLTFARAWRRMNDEKMDQAFPGPERGEVWAAGHSLPNGLIITTGAYVSPPQNPPRGPLPRRPRF
jgi:hypothetical protein